MSPAADEADSLSCAGESKLVPVFFGNIQESLKNRSPCGLVWLMFVYVFGALTGSTAAKGDMPRHEGSADKGGREAH